MRRVRDLLTPVSRARYALWRASKSRSALDVATSSGERLVLRGPPTTDLKIAYEIFLSGAYEPPRAMPPISPKFIVDLGAHVGFTVLLWARRFPSAKILAFEPHLEHLEILYRHVLQNQLGARAEIVGAAASGRSTRAYLAREDCMSHVVDGADSGNAFPIRVRDLFDEIGDARVDFLKMDIEGGEFDILNDSRFAALGIPAIVLEWHDTERTPDGKRWCSDRLTELGYEVAAGKLNYEKAGVLWAWKATHGA